MVRMFVPALGARVRRSRATLHRCQIRLNKSDLCLQRTNATLNRSVEVLARNVRRRQLVPLPSNVVARRRQSDPTLLLYKCPQCGQGLTYHNTRLEGMDPDRPTVTHVYFCLKHGFFHVTGDRSLNGGM